MLKPSLLRKFITDNVKWARENPDKLQVYTTEGTVICHTRPAPGPASFELRYTMVVLVMDYPRSFDILQFAVNAWAERWQPDLLLNPDRKIQFDVDIIDNNTADIQIQFPADEAVIVTRNGDSISIKHRADPLPDDEAGLWTLAFRDMVDGAEWEA